MEFHYTPMEDLTYAQESLAEVMTLGLDTAGLMKDKLIDAFPFVLQGFKANEDLSGLPKFKELTNKQAEFTKHINAVSYAELRELRAIVPEGLVGTYLEYLEVLTPAVEHLREIIPKVLNPYTVFLAHLVSNKAVALSADSHAIHYDRLEHDREATYKAIGALFSNTSHETNSKVGNVVARNADWVYIFTQVKKLSGDLQGIKTANVMELTKQCEDYLEIIYNNLKNGVYEDISPETAKALARGAYQTASEIEYLSIIYYRVLALEASINSTVEKINDILAPSLLSRHVSHNYSKEEISPIEKSHYKKGHICKTPDAIYSTHIGGKNVGISVKLPFETDLTEDESEKLEADLHYAVEKVLSPMFKK